MGGASLSLLVLSFVVVLVVLVVGFITDAYFCKDLPFLNLFILSYWMWEKSEWSKGDRLMNRLSACTTCDTVSVCGAGGLWRLSCRVASDFSDI